MVRPRQTAGPHPGIVEKWSIGLDSTVMDNYIFRAICIKVADEKDPKNLELLKERLQLLLLSEPAPELLTKAEAKPN
jgi:hypothetical protein